MPLCTSGRRPCALFEWLGVENFVWHLSIFDRHLSRCSPIAPCVLSGLSRIVPCMRPVLLSACIESLGGACITRELLLQFRVRITLELLLWFGVSMSRPLTTNQSPGEWAELSPCLLRNMFEFRADSTVTVLGSDNCLVFFKFCVMRWHTPLTANLALLQTRFSRLCVRPD